VTTSRMRSRKVVLLMSLSAAAVLVVTAMCWFSVRHDATQGGVASSSQPVAALSAAGETQASAQVTESPHPVPLPPTSMSTSDRLPAPGTSWVEVLSELMNRAEAGDSAAARRLYQDTTQCQRYLIAKKQAAIELQNLSSRALENDQIDRKDSQLAGISETLDSAAKVCANVSEDQLREHASRIMLAAANAGDEGAATCYVGAFFDSNQTSEMDLDDYKANAGRLAQLGVERGDWSMVALMALAYGDTGGSDAIPPDPEQAYAYTRLLRLGSTGPLAEKKDRQLQAMVDAGTLSQEAIAAGDAWADATYKRYFHDSTIDRIPPPCR
jgi:hypothetical protein